MGTVVLLRQPQIGQGPNHAVEGELQRPKHLGLHNRGVGHGSNVVTAEAGASEGRMAGLPTRKLVTARELMSRIFREVVAECAYERVELASVFNVDPKTVTKWLSGEATFWRFMELPTAGRAMFIRILGERHEQLKGAGR